MSHSPQDVHKKVLGRKGERAVEKYLIEQGMKVLCRNYRTPFGEADLIVADGEETVFVEVKARTSDEFGSGREAVDKAKQRRYYKIAEYYWLQTGEEPNARFDVAELTPDEKIHHYKNAF